MKRNLLLLTTTIILAFILSSVSFGQANFNAIGVAVTQDFNGLTTATFNLTDNTSITGVYAFRANGNAVPNVFTAVSKQYTFTPQVVQINENLDNLNFTAQ